MVPSHQNMFNSAAWEQITNDWLTVCDILQSLLKFNGAEPETTYLTNVFKIPLTQVHVCVAFYESFLGKCKSVRFYSSR